MIVEHPSMGIAKDFLWCNFWRKVVDFVHDWNGPRFYTFKQMHITEAKPEPTFQSTEWMSMLAQLGSSSSPEILHLLLGRKTQKQENKEFLGVVIKKFNLWISPPFLIHQLIMWTIILILQIKINLIQNLKFKYSVTAL